LESAVEAGALGDERRDPEAGGPEPWFEQAMEAIATITTSAGKWPILKTLSVLP
jgi:hypothetical protein